MKSLISIPLTKWTTIQTSSIVVFLLLLAGCAVKRFQPAAGNYIIEDRFAIVRTDSLIVAIRPLSYRSPNNSLNADFFSLFLRVQNISAKSIELPPNSMQILINGKQYSYLPLNYLMLSQPYYQYPFWPDPLSPLSEQEKSWMQREEDRYALFADAFSFGELLAGARKEGYLFYDDDVSFADSLSVNVFGQQVNFVRR